MKALTIARLELLRLIRDRSNLFFVFALPLLLVVLIGGSFGGQSEESRIGVANADDGEDASALVTAIGASPTLEVVAFDVDDRLVDAVGSGEIVVGVVIPADYSRSLTDGTPIEIGFVERSDGSGAAVRPIVTSALREATLAPAAAQAVAGVLDVEVGALMDVAREVEARLPPLTARIEPVAGRSLASEFAGLGRFDLGASSQLFLFVFLTALSSGAALIQTRRFGVARRMLSTPTPVATILVGSAGGRLLVAVAQALYIVIATWLLFRVNWGDPLGTTTVVLLFCLVSAGAGMLLGSVANNDAQAGAAGVGIGLVLAALGGSMVPLEIFPEGMRTVAHITPHAWANEAMAELVRRDGTLADIVLEVAVLGVYAVVLLGAATWALRRALTR